MKFNLALIAAVATSSMLMSSVIAQAPSFTDCATAGRVDGSSTSASAITDCEAKCLPNRCQAGASFDATLPCDPTPSGQICNQVSYTIESCPKWNVPNSDQTACEQTPALKDAEKDCNQTALDHGKKVMDVSGNPVCQCEHGEDSGVCKCADADEVRNTTSGKCEKKVITPPFTCASVGRKDPTPAAASTTAAAPPSKPEECGECTEGTHCIYADGKCAAAPENGKCGAGKKVECNEGFELKDGKCEKKVKDSEKAKENENENEETPEQKNARLLQETKDSCTKNNRKFLEADKKCGDCEADHMAVVDGGMCFKTTTEDECKKVADKMQREFNSEKKLCLCKGGKKAKVEGEEHSLTAACINGAAQVLVSSVVLLSSVAATTLFFL